MIISENIIKKVLVLKNHFNKKMFILLIGNVLTILFNILSVKLLTNKYSTNDFGEYSLIISSASFFQLVLFAPISASIMPFINREKEMNRYSTFQQTIFSLFNTMVFALLGFGIIFCCFNYIFEIVSIDVIFILFTLL